MILLFKLIYGIYFGFITLYGLHLGSNLLFGRARFSIRLKRFFKGLAISIAWPIMIFSSGGIKTLKNNLNKL